MLVAGDENVPLSEYFQKQPETVKEFIGYASAICFDERHKPLKDVLPTKFPFQNMLDNYDKIHGEWRTCLAPSFVAESTALKATYTREKTMAFEAIKEASRQGIDSENPVVKYANSEEKFTSIFDWYFGFETAYIQMIQGQKARVFVPFLFLMNSDSDSMPMSYWPGKGHVQMIGSTSPDSEIFTNYFDTDPRSHHTYSQSLIIYGFFPTDEEYKGDASAPLTCIVPKQHMKTVAPIIAQLVDVAPSWMGESSDDDSELTLTFLLKEALLAEMVDPIIKMIQTVESISTKDAAQKLLKQIDDTIEEFHLDVEKDREYYEDASNPEPQRQMAFIRMSDAKLYEVIKNHIQSNYSSQPEPKWKRWFSFRSHK